MECSPDSSGRWPTASSVCGAHGSCVQAPADAAAEGSPAYYYCTCDAGWSSSGDFMSPPFASCHVHQQAVLGMWVAALVATCVLGVLWAGVVRRYVAILAAQTQRKEHTRD